MSTPFHVRFSCHKAGVDCGVKAPKADMSDAFRRGEGDYVHLQGPNPQQLEQEGAGHVMAAFGDVSNPCAFSSIAATPEVLRTDLAKAFGRACRRARDHINDSPAMEVARAETPYLPETHLDVLANAIGAYQKMGCSTRHAEITRLAYEASVDSFEFNGMIKSRPPYEAVVAPTP